MSDAVNRMQQIIDRMTHGPVVDFVSAKSAMQDGIDEIERLTKMKNEQHHTLMTFGNDIRELRDEIERLTANCKTLDEYNDKIESHNSDLEEENERLRAALERIAMDTVNPTNEESHYARVAREALAKEADNE